MSHILTLVRLILGILGVLFLTVFVQTNQVTLGVWAIICFQLMTM